MTPEELIAEVKTQLDAETIPISRGELKTLLLDRNVAKGMTLTRAKINAEYEAEVYFNYKKFEVFKAERRNETETGSANRLQTGTAETPEGDAK